MGETNISVPAMKERIFSRRHRRIRPGRGQPPLHRLRSESWLDYDNDGFLDLYAVNGAVETVNALRGTPYPYKMKNRLFHNDGGRKFTDVSDTSGAALQLEAVGRGLAIGDLNNDGRVDMIATNNNGQPWLLLNQDESAGHWLLVDLEGVKTNRQGLGAEVGVLRPGGRIIWRRSIRMAVTSAPATAGSFRPRQRYKDRRRGGSLGWWRRRGISQCQSRFHREVEGRHRPALAVSQTTA